MANRINLMEVGKSPTFTAIKYYLVTVLQAILVKGGRNHLRQSPLLILLPKIVMIRSKKDELFKDLVINIIGKITSLLTHVRLYNLKEKRTVSDDRNHADGQRISLQKWSHNVMTLGEFSQRRMYKGKDIAKIIILQRITNEYASF